MDIAFDRFISKKGKLTLAEAGVVAETLYSFYKESGDSDILCEYFYRTSHYVAGEFFRRYVETLSDDEMDSIRDSMEALYLISQDKELQRELGIVFETFPSSFCMVADTAIAVWGEPLADALKRARAAEAKVRELEKKLDETREMLSDAETSKTAELLTLKQDIKDALRPQYNDWSENGSAKMTEENYTALRTNVSQIFKSLRRLGIVYKYGE